MKLIVHRYRGREIVFFALFYLLVFQNPLTKYVSEVFAYVDELFGLLAIAFALCPILRGSKITVKRDTIEIAALLCVFVLCGLIGNLLFLYQPAEAVLEDLYVNLKFFLSVAAGFCLLRYAGPSKERIVRHTKFCALILFALLASDMAFGLFPDGGYRYGLRIHNLIFGHVTYLAGTCVFLLSVFLFYFEKRNVKYMVLVLLVLISTLRGKALAGAAAYLIVLYFVLIRRQKIKLLPMLAIAVAALYLAWDQISYYYIELSGQSARSVLTQTAFEVMRDHFPIGTGFGTYGSNVAGENYSPVYVRYGFLHVFELYKNSDYLSDTFWPIVIGQTGFIGTVCYLAVLLKLFRKAVKVRSFNKGAYAAVLFVFIYLLISSTSEPTFCNPVSIPLAMILGFAICTTQTGGQMQQNEPAESLGNYERKQGT